MRGLPLREDAEHQVQDLSDQKEFRHAVKKARRADFMMMKSIRAS